MGLAKRFDAGGPTRKGFGRVLIEEALSYELNAETHLAFGENQVRCTLALPLKPKD